MEKSRTACHPRLLQCVGKTQVSASDPIERLLVLDSWGYLVASETNSVDFVGFYNQVWALDVERFSPNQVLYLFL